MKKSLRKLKALTLAEIMVTFAVMAIIITASTKILQSRSDYETRFMTYSALTTLRQAVGNLIADGCTAADITDGYCTVSKEIPLQKHNADSRGFCDRLVLLLNTVGAVDCDLSAATAATDFSTETPAFVLSNGLRFFFGETLFSPPYYIIYVDINGTKGNGELGQDVVEFMVQGPFTPAGNIVEPNNLVSQSTDHISANVRMTNSSGQEVTVYSNVTYYNASCLSGKWSGMACFWPTIVRDTTNCPVANNTCEVIINKPSSMFFNPK